MTYRCYNFFLKTLCNSVDKLSEYPSNHEREIMTKLILILTSILSFAAIASSSIPAVKKNTVSVMTYNLENLFDTKHDEGKQDWTYLPLSFKNSSAEVQAYCHSITNEWWRKDCLELDWSDEVVSQKIANLSKVILSYNNGKGADILVFQEVENINALKMLVNQGLRKHGYKYISLVEGPDTRGIDVGMISRLPIKKEKLHILNLAPHSHRTTRGILEVEFKLGSKRITIFGNHWPSQGNIDETRMVAGKVLKEATRKSRSDLIIATGDFNTSSDDELNAIETYILPVYTDVEVKGRKYSNVTAKGTHWYRGHWESLDKIFVAKKSIRKGRVKVDYRSFDILDRSFMLKDLEWTDYNTGTTQISHDIPNRFNIKTGKGFSDHLPVAIEIDL